MKIAAQCGSDKASTLRKALIETNNNYGLVKCTVHQVYGVEISSGINNNINNNNHDVTLTPPAPTLKVNPHPTSGNTSLLKTQVCTKQPKSLRFSPGSVAPTKDKEARSGWDTDALPSDTEVKDKKVKKWRCGWAVEKRNSDICMSWADGAMKLIKATLLGYRLRNVSTPQVIYSSLHLAFRAF